MWPRSHAMGPVASAQHWTRAGLLSLSFVLAAGAPALGRYQRLIPTPFPETLGGNAAPLDPRPFTGASASAPEHRSLSADARDQRARQSADRATGTPSASRAEHPQAEVSRRPVRRGAVFLHNNATA